MKYLILRLKKYIFIFSILLLFSPITHGQRTFLGKKLIQGHTLYTLLKPGDIPAIFNPLFIDIREASELYYDKEPLMVVVANGKAKAYSTWHLDQHEVVNDIISGTNIVATW